MFNPMDAEVSLANEGPPLKLWHIVFIIVPFAMACCLWIPVAWAGEKVWEWARRCD